MEDKEIIEMLDEMSKFFGGKLANPKHHPKQFKNQLKIFKYYNNDSTELQVHKDDVIDFTKQASGKT